MNDRFLSVKKRTKEYGLYCNAFILSTSKKVQERRLICYGRVQNSLEEYMEKKLPIWYYQGEGEAEDQRWGRERYSGEKHETGVGGRRYSKTGVNWHLTIQNTLIIGISGWPARRGEGGLARVNGHHHPPPCAATTPCAVAAPPGVFKKVQNLCLR